MAEMSEIYQASLRPHPPYKPLPDETAFANYFSPPPVAPDNRGNYVPYFNYYAPAAPPPLPPQELLSPPLPASIENTRKSPTGKNQGGTSSETNQPLQNFMMYGAVVLGILVIFTLTVMFAYAMAGRNSGRGREDGMAEGSGGYRPRPTDHPGFRREASMVVPLPNKAPQSHPARGHSDEDRRAD
ncbi:hypothetical protein MTO96_031613 [Rhipicephalus appendiculatus]